MPPEDLEQRVVEGTRELARTNEALRTEITARLESLSEEERIRISREIHDELGQKLTGLKMDLPGHAFSDYH